MESKMTYKILVVDEELSARVIIREMLADLDAEIVFGSNWRDALEISAEISPDLLIISRNLPFQSGIAASRIIHMSLPGLPILMLAEDISGELREHALKAGVSRILYKPIDREELSFFAILALGAAHESV